MHISVSEAKGQLTELVRRAEAGEEVVLTRFGQPVARLVPEARKPTPAERNAVIAEIMASARPTPGPSAARSQDFLYDENGLPK
ncbi:MAG: type II toxin-antitoxin system prevent-host-death family antitoxin [Inquilinus limosus]|uniref:Antitoxin n=1 Tax=Inquilinus limosus TaxID=171674 RepID=A0A952FQH3_9PROT|nr:type II toxin-antitoxin system prevent-host-death family antitoxin [Inquilinus limosus]